jgi:hypothetical protein
MAKRRVTLMAFNHTPQDYLGDEQLQQVQRIIIARSLIITLSPRAR